MLSGAAVRLHHAHRKPKQIAHSAPTIRRQIQDRTLPGLWRVRYLPGRAPWFGAHPGECSPTPHWLLVRAPHWSLQCNRHSTHSFGSDGRRRIYPNPDTSRSPGTPFDPGAAARGRRATRPGIAGARSRPPCWGNSPQAERARFDPALTATTSAPLPRQTITSPSGIPSDQDRAHAHGQLMIRMRSISTRLSP
jgi:hypothetical protein